MNFPHMSDTDFPNVEGVNAYKYQNSFDYSKYDETQMTIGVCSVPWDVGLIHVGNAQIGGLGNVVYFESKADRDAYIDSREGFRWDTKYRAYHSDGYIEVPLPYEKCVLYNYIYCEYTLLPVEYAEGGKDRFCFFIRECEYLSPNATKVRILRDTWQTFIYDVDISYMMLERGHAPMGLVSADRYLSNPVDNTRYLLADDVNYGEATVNRYSASQILNNGDMWAVVVSSVDYSDNPGDKRDDTWHVPEQGTAYSDGQPSSFAFAIEPGSLSRFLDLVNSNAPQLTQCIKAVFFVEKALVETIESFRFLGFTLRRLAGKESDLPVIELAKAQFGYGERYADIAKLYTMPYAHLEITDESGNVSIVKIEDTQGNLSLQLTTSVAYPWLSLDGHLSGVGKSSGSVVFKNITSHSFDFEGSWYDHLHRWKIPTFAVQQAAQDNYDFATHFDRQQRNAEIGTTYDNTVRSADAAKASADASDNTGYGNAVRSADAAKASADASDNTAYGNAVRSADAAKANADASDNAAYANAVRSADAAKTSADASDNTAYGNAVRSANATKANADASDNAAYTNAVRSADAAKASADARDNTAYGNAVRSADATKANADANDLATRTVAENNAQTAYDNAVRLNETSANNIIDANAASQQDRINASRTAKENTEKLNKATTDNQADAVGTALIHNTNARAFASEKITIQETKMDGDAQWDYAITAVQAALTAKLNLATMVTNSLQQGMSAAISGAQMGAIAGAALGPVGMAGGALASAGGGLLGSAANTAFAAANYALVVSNDQDQLSWNNGYILAKKRLAKNYNFDMTNKDLDFQETQMRNNNSLSTSTTNRSVNASNETARASHNAEVENANRDKSTGDNNAIRSKETANENALADYNNTMANSDEFYNTGTSNNARANTAAKTNANQTLTTELANNSRANTTAKANANQSRVTGLDNNARANTAAKTNAEQTRITELANNERANKTAKANANQSRVTGLDNNARTNTAAKTNAEQTRVTELANNARANTTAKTNASQTLATELANNARANTTAKANASASKQTALDGIERDIKQAALQAPLEFGEYSDGDTAATRPIGIFCNIVTQSQDAIEQAGDYFLRFGYAVNRSWDFETFNIMPKFTYWKASDMWISGNNVPDAYLDEIRFYLLGGVCVWRDPNDIGRISIYQNV